MAAQTYGSSTQTLAAPPRVNLLPPEIAEKAKVRRAQLAMVGVGVGAVAVVGALYMQSTAKVSEAETEKQRAVARHTVLQGELRKLDHVKQTYAQVDQANKTLSNAMHYEVRWSSYLHDLTLTIPENVWLKEMEVDLSLPKVPGPGSEPVLDQGLGTVTFKGLAFGYKDVAAWLDSLAKQKGYSDPYYTKAESKQGTKDLVDFESTVYINDKARSNRYAKGLNR